MVLIERQRLVVNRHFHLGEYVNIVIIRPVLYVLHFSLYLVIHEPAEHARHLKQRQDLYVVQRQSNERPPEVTKHPAVAYLTVHQDYSVIEIHVLQRY